MDIRLVDQLPATQRIAQVLGLSPEDLIASKVISYHQRRGKPKAGTDWRDLIMLLLAFPDLKQAVGPVAEQLKIAGADANAFTV